ncbi:hypothetical protein QBC34DRAFT_18282 [Podospora aff. communis PSN243]|uniref:Uncharacterized protein n=1 Tax=Podospora aff. communis PSN243 TaxID=3040156 RepID=A0AAV9GX03_9PEZI|nr:hypothetical protein QBC34DRAFT_18282 [Podospora aff. communis PSN243]
MVPGRVGGVAEPLEAHGMSHGTHLLFAQRTLSSREHRQYLPTHSQTGPLDTTQEAASGLLGFELSNKYSPHRDNILLAELAAGLADQSFSVFTSSLRARWRSISLRLCCGHQYPPSFDNVCTLQIAVISRLLPHVEGLRELKQDASRPLSAVTSGGPGLSQHLADVCSAQRSGPALLFSPGSRSLAASWTSFPFARSWTTRYGVGWLYQGMLCFAWHHDQSQRHCGKSSTPGRYFPGQAGWTIHCCREARSRYLRAMCHESGICSREGISPFQIGWQRGERQAGCVHCVPPSDLLPLKTICQPRARPMRFGA